MYVYVYIYTHIYIQTYIYSHTKSNLPTIKMSMIMSEYMPQAIADDEMNSEFVDFQLRSNHWWYFQIGRFLNIGTDVCLHWFLFPCFSFYSLRHWSKPLNLVQLHILAPPSIKDPGLLRVHPYSVYYDTNICCRVFKFYQRYIRWTSSIWLQKHISVYWRVQLFNAQL